MKLTPHYCPLMRMFLHLFTCTINNISNIDWTAFSTTTLQKLCKVMPHTALQGLMTACTKSLACIIFGGRTEFLTNWAHLTNFWNISIIWYKFNYINYLYFKNGYTKLCVWRAMSIVTGYGLGNWGLGVQVPAGSRFFSSPCRPDHLWDPP
jgi:hypothetical protein